MTENSWILRTTSDVDLTDFVKRLTASIKAEVLDEVDRRVAAAASDAPQLTLPTLSEADQVWADERSGRGIWAGRLRSLIERRGDSLDEFASEIGTTSSSLRDWDSGRWPPSQANHALLLSALGVTVDDVLAVDFKPSPTRPQGNLRQMFSAKQTYLVNKQAAVDLQKQLPALRAVKKMSIRQLAEASGNSRSAISRWERGVAPISTTRVEGLLKALGVTARDVIGKAEYRRLTGAAA